MHDYERLVQAVLKIATSIYRCCVCTENPYPNDKEQLQWAGEAWARACQDKGIDIEMDEEHSKLVFPLKDPFARSGMYEHPIIQQLINTMWFRDPHDEGIVYKRYFK
ncbi:hypothetical protein JAAARDRAFT_126234 [Jaapia argillacea MUCL 33604]|uniref:DUF6532 domain-containing protein n=1 Tax=Jaapia argillacea MUCL 33604 TaxID=933084 RepID=A0A067QBW8_9AGAM|nr:hypothetical protein JAAARDRAFT_126234 [Jaapia argillacea MUCL 33604]